MVRSGSAGVGAGRATRSRRNGRVDGVVFGVAGVLAVAFVAWGGWGAGSLSGVANRGLGWIETNFGWAFVLAATGFVVFVLWLACSRYGGITLGREGDQPRFKTLPWIAMMFAAGMGIGLIFYGVYEPLHHFTSPPPETVAPNTDAALQTAMDTTMFHWALHPWSCYALVGLAIAYSTHRKGRPQLISAACTPLLGARARGPIGKAIDILAIFATLFGSAASLGLSALQIGSGLTAAGFLANVSTLLLVVVVIVLTTAFICSAISGIERGVQWLAAANGALALALALFVFLVGPSVFILNLLPTSLGDYLKDLPAMAARTAATGGPAMATWLSQFTIFDWAWWITWTPFVGMFIAEISRGRTIRQFVGGVILVPSLVSLVWFAIFGGAAIAQQRAGDNLAAQPRAESQLFGLLHHYPAATLSSLVAIAVVGVFFVSGADAASIVMGSLSQYGTHRPAKPVIAFWGALTGAVAVIMLLIGHGQDTALSGLQSLTIIVASPFVIIMILLAIAMIKDLRTDHAVLREDKGTEVINAAIDHGTTHYGNEFYLRVDTPRTTPSPPTENPSPARHTNHQPPPQPHTNTTTPTDHQ